MRLLIVEDNIQLSQLLAKGLHSAGYETDCLATAAEARTALMTTSYAAMILDLGLPDGDGLAILRELRHRKDSLPVMVLTARGGLHDRVNGLRSGADDYLASNSEAPCALLIWSLTFEIGKRRSMMSRRSCRRGKPRCLSF